MKAGPEPHAAILLERLLASRAALLAAEPDARLLAFWDLDGTLLHGDCSEGLHEEGRTVYPGLVQCAIEAGFSDDYPEVNGFALCWGDYRLLRDRFGDWLAYPFLAQVFAGAEEERLRELARRHFDAVLHRYFYAASRAVFDGLAAAGIEQHILSASPDFFVAGAAGILGLQPGRLHGIRLRVEEGRLTREISPPVTRAEGKLARLHQVVAATGASGVPVRVLAAFGNSHATDGDFLAHVAAQTWPAGRPLAVMINPDRNRVRPSADFLTYRQQILVAGGPAA